MSNDEEEKGRGKVAMVSWGMEYQQIEEGKILFASGLRLGMNCRPRHLEFDPH